MSMDQSLIPKILRIQQEALEDKAYQELLQEYDAVNARLLEIYPTLSPQQWDAVADYIGLAAAMHLRMLELALSGEMNCDNA